MNVEYKLKIIEFIVEHSKKFPLSLFHGLKNKIAYIDMHEYLNSRDDPVVNVRVFSYTGELLDEKYFGWMDYGEVWIDCGEIDLWEAADCYVQQFLKVGAVIRNSNRNKNL